MAAALRAKKGTRSRGDRQSDASGCPTGSVLRCGTMAQCQTTYQGGELRRLSEARDALVAAMEHLGRVDDSIYRTINTDTRDFISSIDNVVLSKPFEITELCWQIGRLTESAKG